MLAPLLEPPLLLVAAGSMQSHLPRLHAVCCHQVSCSTHGKYGPADIASGTSKTTICSTHMLAPLPSHLPFILMFRYYCRYSYCCHSYCEEELPATEVPIAVYDSLTDSSLDCIATIGGACFRSSKRLDHYTPKLHRTRDVNEVRSRNERKRLTGPT